MNIKEERDKKVVGFFTDQPQLQFYLGQGLRLIPLVKNPKSAEEWAHPIVNWKQYREREPTLEEYQEWSKKTDRFAILTGYYVEGKGFVVGIDVDNEQVATKLNLGELWNNTYTEVRTRDKETQERGFHSFFFSEENLREKYHKTAISLEYQNKPAIEFKIATLLTAGGTRYESGGVYEHFLTAPTEIKTAPSGLIADIIKRFNDKFPQPSSANKRGKKKGNKNKRGNIEEFKAKINISEIIEGYGGVEKVDEYSDGWMGLCPFHDDTKPSFKVYPETQSFYCFGCEAGGDVIKFVQLKEDCDFHAAIRKLEDITGLVCAELPVNKFASYDTSQRAGGVVGDWCKRCDKRQSGAKAKTDVIYLDEKGRRKINYEVLLENLEEEYIFKTAEDTEEVFYYNEGIYKPAEKIIKKYVEDAVGDLATIQLRRETIGHIQCRYYTPREEFNKDKTRLPLKNGLLNLETFELEPHTPDKIFTHRFEIDFDKEAKCPNIEKFFSEVLHPADIPVMQEIFGLCLYADYPVHKAFWWLGGGRNGKTVTASLIISLLGRKNVAHVQLVDLDGSHRFAEARLEGKLVNLIDEPAIKKPMETERFKALTGGGSIEGEKKGCQEPIQFTSYATMIIQANKIPRIYDSTDAFHERTLVIPFDNQFLGSKAIKNLGEKLVKKDGLSGLLNWALEGLKRLKKNDWEFTESDTRARALGDFLRESNPVRQFVQEWFVPDIQHDIVKEDLYNYYIEYCEEYDIVVPSEKSFTTDLKRCAKVTTVRRNIGGVRQRCWRGLRKIEKEVTEGKEGKVYIGDHVGQHVHDPGLRENHRGKNARIVKRSDISPIGSVSTRNMDMVDQVGIGDSSDFIGDSSDFADCECCGRVTRLRVTRLRDGTELMVCNECRKDFEEEVLSGDVGYADEDEKEGVQEGKVRL
ncbi:MAG: phage/plasmid primase, P4 family [Methanophagales archaeon]|nr:phage/plasmid primase, P4 family [Methanophagales archaeon]